MVPVLTSFLPPSHIQQYLPTLFAIWEAFNSNVIDDRLTELVGDLAEEHVAGTAGVFGTEGGAQWRDVGIWAEDQWTFLMSKCLGSMSKAFSFRLFSFRLTNKWYRRAYRSIQGTCEF